MVRMRSAKIPKHAKAIIPIAFAVMTIGNAISYVQLMSFSKDALGRGDISESIFWREQAERRILWIFIWAILASGSGANFFRGREKESRRRRNELAERSTSRNSPASDSPR